MHPRVTFVAGPSVRLSVSDAIHRGFNIFVVAALGLTGLAFGSDIIPELMDKPIYATDDILLAVIGLVAVAWYFVGRHRYQRSSLPLVLVGLALIVQAAGFVIEIGDSGDLGDDIAGLILFVALLIVAALVYRANGQLETETVASTSPH